MATHVPAGLMGLGADYGLKIGARADLLITDTEDAERLVAGGADRMIVVARGRPVATDMAWPT